MLTLHAVAVAPTRVTWEILDPTGPDLVLRPLESADRDCLEAFLEGLGATTRRFYDVTDPETHALEMCDAIDRFDKLRFVLVDESQAVAGLVELSFGLPPGDQMRFDDYGMQLRPGLDVRIALCLADALQGSGVAADLWPHIVSVTRQFGCTRILLWGGVYATNERARGFYNRLGFTEVGRFYKGAVECLDMVLDIG